MSLVTLEIANGVARVVLNRPEKRNALNVPLMEALIQALEKAKKTRVLLLSGEGKVFCAGLDLKETKGETLVAEVLTRLYELPCVTIAVVHGAAIAGGAGLMAACDLVVSHIDTLFGFPEVRRGLVAAQVMACLIRRTSFATIRELTLLGELIDANRALEMGLVNRVVKDPLLAAEEMADQVLKGAPQAVRDTKKLLQEFDSFTDDLKNALPYHKKARQSEEAKEGMRAFLEGREPKW